ncbi:LacI family DNA-binding transcriptional regulator [Microbacterium amylolyticum]|uniref:DNA-binding LacI/PurR family transcriptional regulator n=1 Tax=Microbacterium amylolyticum TaxID=936337 RepID=A0ABS4ZF95_9MICO|nr:LacI family DNA-binding transcriptional regulator [Microbacterium amylolyticum]MBP2435887.1 DNA-binding LacI/PurR family transcriptional regulator [Microbacterium amylolyticum]
MAVTLKDVAQAAGVSIKTVSNVINDYPHIRPITREKVEQVITELGYTPNQTARNLRSGRTGVIALAVPDLSLAYFAELAAAVIEAAEKASLTVQVEQTGGTREREIALLRTPRLQQTDGVLFSPLEMSQSDAHLLDVGYPLVLLGERIFGANCDHVTMRNTEAARAATDFLLDTGRRRIALVGAHEGEVIGSAGLRLKGYRDALDARGIAYDEQLVAPAGEWHRVDGLESARELLERGVEFDALFALNDTLAFGAIRALEESGRRVPDDVAVIGFDNIDESAYSLPALTTVDPGREWIAQRAVDALVERIANADLPPRQELAAFRVIERESAVAPGARD